MQGFKVALGGAERRLSFSHEDAETLWKSFPVQCEQRGLYGLLVHDVLGFEMPEPDAKPGASLGLTARFNPVARNLLIYLALARAAPGLTAAKVHGWLGEHTSEPGRSVWPVAALAACAAFESGAITGESFDLWAVVGPIVEAMMGKETAVLGPPTVPSE